MSSADSLGDRMKRYEAASRLFLPSRTYTIIRADGRAFHTLLRKSPKPFDDHFIGCIRAAAARLCEEVSGAVLAYIQSDEISLLVTDFAHNYTEPWFAGNVQKIASVSASIVTAAFNDDFPDDDHAYPANFDARVFTISSSVEVANYFLWRQRDWMRNSVSMLARSKFSHKQLHGKSCNQMQEMLWQEHGINWNDLPAHLKRGSICIPVTREKKIEFREKGSGNLVSRDGQGTAWECGAAPEFRAEPGTWLATVIPALPML